MKRNFTFFLLFGLCAIFATRRAGAVPAIPHPIEYTQSDGTRLKIRIIGDEFLHYTVSEEGYTLTGGDDGDLYFATLSPDGRLVPTAVKARPLGALPAAQRAEVSKLVRGIRPAMTTEMRERMAALRSLSPASAPAAAARANTLPNPPGRISSAPTTGRVRSLILLVEFQDRKFATPSPQQAFQNLLMQTNYSSNGAMGSARDYYLDNSNGKFDPDFVVAGPYTVSHNSLYYAGSSGTENVAELIVEACRAADKDIDFSQFADGGVIRDVFVFYAGQGRAAGGNSTTIWPHRWDVRGDRRYTAVYLDGVNLQGYACSCELNYYSQMDGIGTFCHEFGHVLGWPDFYDTDYDSSGGTATALGNYSLMCSGSYNNNGRTPPAVNILERWMVGWAEPEEIADMGVFELGPVWEDRGFLVRTPVENDYFLLECRGVSGSKWDSYITTSGGGMMVYHVDYTSKYQNAWLSSNNLNANPQHECMKMLPSYGSGQNADYFYPGQHNATALTYEGNSNYRSWSGSEPNVDFSSIRLQGTRVQLLVEGELPDVGFAADAAQYDAVIRWNGDLAGSWRIRWSDATGRQIGNQTVKGSVFHIGGLTPDATYEVGITPLGGPYYESEQTFELTTQPRNTSRRPHIALAADGYRSGEPFALRLLDGPQNVRTVIWYVDEQAADSYLTLDAGEHLISAIVVTETGRFYLMKYITVK